eukprot:846324-Prymnesium_polylepis.1
MHLDEELGVIPLDPFKVGSVESVQVENGVRHDEGRRHRFIVKQVHLAKVVLLVQSPHTLDRVLERRVFDENGGIAPCDKVERGRSHSSAEDVVARQIYLGLEAEDNLADHYALNARKCGKPRVERGGDRLR